MDRGLALSLKLRIHHFYKPFIAPTTQPALDMLLLVEIHFCCYYVSMGKDKTSF